MSALEIRPHSRRVSGLAVLVLTLLAAGSFSAGLAHQIGAANAPSPFPVAQEASPQVSEASPTPAADLQLAASVPAPHRARAETPPALDVPPETVTATDPLPATDASATVADQPAPTPAPAPPQDAPNL